MRELQTVVLQQGYYCPLSNLNPDSSCIFHNLLIFRWVIIVFHRMERFPFDLWLEIRAGLVKF